MLNPVTWLPARTLDEAEGQLARWEHNLMLAERGDDKQAIEKATYRRDHAAVECAKIRHGRT